MAFPRVHTEVPCTVILGEHCTRTPSQQGGKRGHQHGTAFAEGKAQLSDSLPRGEELVEGRGRGLMAAAVSKL